MRIDKKVILSHAAETLIHKIAKFDIEFPGIPWIEIVNKALYLDTQPRCFMI